MPDNSQHIANYKTVLRSVIEARPSGMSQRLSEALGKNRSFISQISNPNYRIPVPYKHLDKIFTVCGFSSKLKEEFLEEYYLAHPKYINHSEDKATNSTNSLLLKKTGNEKLDKEIEKAVISFTNELTSIYKKHLK